MCWARRDPRLRNSGTALAIASTPVSAEQPEANALSSSRMPTASVAGRQVVRGRDGRVRPEQAADDHGAMATMNSTVGTMNSRADSATPHMFAAGDHRQDAQAEPDPVGVQGGEGRASASTPADTPTAAFRM